MKDFYLIQTIQMLESGLKQQQAQIDKLNNQIKKKLKLN
jgi:hypothetical protein